MKTTKITIGRLFNLGSYEHVRYEFSVELQEGDSAEQAVIGLEKIMEALKPERNCCVKTHSELRRGAAEVLELKAKLMRLSEDDFRHSVGHFVGTPEEYIARVEAAHIKEVANRCAYEKRAKKARELLDDLGASEKFTDVKLDWQSLDEEEV